MNIQIRSVKNFDLQEFLLLNNFSVETVNDHILSVSRDGELPVFLHFDELQIYFQLDLGNVESLASKDFYFKLLDLNTEILPVSLGINSANPDDPRLVLVESREISNLDENEVLSVFDSLELATDKVEELLQKELS